MPEPTDTLGDLSQFEGHMPGEWEATAIAFDDPEWGAHEIWAGDMLISSHVSGAVNAALCAAAPALLAEVRRLREMLELSEQNERYAQDDFRLSQQQCRALGQEINDLKIKLAKLKVGAARDALKGHDNA